MSTPEAKPIECPACIEKRIHTEQDWKFHPYRGHGWLKEIGYTHPDLKRAKPQ